MADGLPVAWRLLATRAASQRAGKWPKAATGGVSLVYFVRCGLQGPIKIGLAKDGNIARRLCSLQSGNHEPLHVIAYTPGDRTTERDLHRRFRPSRVINEWFEPTEELVALCDRVGHGGAL